MKTKAEIVERLLEEDLITAEEAVVLLKEVEIINTPTIQPYVPYTPIIVDREDDMVPYGTICPCNPVNGGSGICGCIMGNRLVPNVKGGGFQQITTTDNIKCNNDSCFCDGTCKG